MTSMQDAPRRRRVVVGVDTHKHIHVAVALDELGGRIEARSFAADRSGYEQLIDWASSLGREVMFGVEGTGSYGAGLASAIRRRSIGVLEVLHTDRRDRRLRGKSDTTPCRRLDKYQLLILLREWFLRPNGALPRS
jgi:transposase